MKILKLNNFESFTFMAGPGSGGGFDSYDENKDSDGNGHNDHQEPRDFTSSDSGSPSNSVPRESAVEANQRIVEQNRAAAEAGENLAANLGGGILDEEEIFGPEGAPQVIGSAPNSRFEGDPHAPSGFDANGRPFPDVDPSTVGSTPEESLAQVGAPDGTSGGASGSSHIDAPAESGGGFLSGVTSFARSAWDAAGNALDRVMGDGDTPATTNGLFEGTPSDVDSSNESSGGWNGIWDNPIGRTISSGVSAAAGAAGSLGFSAAGRIIGGTDDPNTAVNERNPIGRAWDAVEDWADQEDFELGDPDGPPVRNGNVVTQTYQNGATVTTTLDPNNPDGEALSVSMQYGDTRIDTTRTADGGLETVRVENDITTTTSFNSDGDEVDRDITAGEGASGWSLTGAFTGAAVDNIDVNGSVALGLTAVGGAMLTGAFAPVVLAGVFTTAATAGVGGQLVAGAAHASDNEVIDRGFNENGDMTWRSAVNMLPENLRPYAETALDTRDSIRDGDFVGALEETGLVSDDAMETVQRGASILETAQGYIERAQDITDNPEAALDGFVSDAAQGAINAGVNAGQEFANAARDDFNSGTAPAAEPAAAPIGPGALDR